MAVDHLKAVGAAIKKSPKVIRKKLGSEQVNHDGGLYSLCTSTSTRVNMEVAILPIVLPS